MKASTCKCGLVDELASISSVGPEAELVAQSSASKSYARSAVVFWDLDNKRPPPDVSLRQMLGAIRSTLLTECDAVEAVNIYANDVTLMAAYGYKRRHASSALEIVMQAPDVPLECPICGKELFGNTVMRYKKFEQHRLRHLQKQKTQQLLRSSLGGRMRDGQSDQMRGFREKYALGSQVMRQAFDEFDDVYMQAAQDMGSTQTTSMSPVRSVPQAADQKLIADWKETMSSERAQQGVGTLGLISDDNGYIDTITKARYKGWQVVTFSKNSLKMKNSGDRSCLWEDLVSHARTLPGAAVGELDVSFQEFF